MRIILSLAFVLWFGPAFAQQSPTRPPSQSSSAEMKQIFQEDQDVRQPAPKAAPRLVPRDDAARREATKKLLDAGALHTGDDFFEAAVVFQHGDRPDDYLLAHTLACIAVAKGNRDGLWIAAATLDRYLQKIGQPQIYGTQFSRANQDAPWTQDPYDRDLISDALREQLGVPPLAAQADQLKHFQSQFPSHPQSPPK
ncbi:MAG TPA: hypothetical protein VMD97_04185 [Candidatus Aquilonibacter sp.]|nr:hypothetical protein [Candidatus Aquilonibacter sp.]